MRRAAHVVLAVLLWGCPKSEITDPPEQTPSPPRNPPTEPTPPPVVELRSTAMRLLSKRELQLTLQTLTSVTPEALELLPPDGSGHGFDRVVEGQTVSRPQADAWQAIAIEVADTLLAERRLDEIAEACRDQIMPPLAPRRATTVVGSSLSYGPQWSADTDPAHPERGGTRYAPDPLISYTHTFATPGRYRLTLEGAVTARSTDSVQLSLDGAMVAQWGEWSGPFSEQVELDVATAGPHVLEIRVTTEPDENNLALYFDALNFDGPMDLGAAFDAERDQCAHQLIDTFAPRAFRRPLTAEHRAALVRLYELGAAESFNDGVRMVLQAVLTSPFFLHLVELGAPVPDRPGVYELTPWELAARLSYALCERPPDDALREATATGRLDLEAHAGRLFDAECGRATAWRFFEQWLHLDRLPELNKDPDAFALWSDDVRAGQLAEARRFLDEIVDDGDLHSLFSADWAWPDPRSAAVWGLSDVETTTRTAVPPSRAGILTHPGVLAVTAHFDSTSPVTRGVFVLERILCGSVPPPPPGFDIAPPIPDPSLTTRQRWAAHSANPACRGCHEMIDPIGFAFEGFDAIGRHRTEENGLPIDTAGALPLLEVDVSDAASAARAIADAPRAASCLAEQWLRFTLGRLRVPTDASAIEHVATALRTGKLRDAFVSIATTETFRQRTEAPR